MHHPTLSTWLLAFLSLFAGIRPAACQQPAEPPAAPRRLQVLFFGAPTANGPHHDPITRYRVLKKALGTAGIDLVYLEDPAVVFTAATLAPFDALLMYGNWEQHGRMPIPQLQTLLAYVEGGRGFLPIHCASACYGATPQFRKLVGARFLSHGGEEFTVDDVLPEHPILQGRSGFRAWDETYVHDEHAEDRTILQVRDGEPWTWTRQQGQGRVFYTAAGHDHRVWDRAEFQDLLRNAILWAVGPERRELLQRLQLPQLETEAVSLPGYRERREITLAQKPLSPSESQKLAQVPIGMSLQLFASEPQIVNPIHVAWDPRGRAFVIETIDYPNNLQANNLGHDRITICEDRDGDGKADRFVRFAEQLSIPTSLTFANGGVIATNGSEMLFLRDTDGDDVADERRVLFAGFSMGDTHAGVSNLRYGIDGWVYATIGYSGFRGEVGGVRHEFAQGVFRFRPDGSALEFLQNTTNNTWGLGFTEAFDVVGSTANGNPSWYFTFADAERRRLGLPTPPTPRADTNPLFFPMSTDIRQVDSFDRYTSAAGHAVYTARTFPSPYHDRIAFVCEPTGKLVGQFVLVRDGASFRAEQLPENLYASADAWSAPVCAEVGPDGAIWICDWYNLIVQHNPTPTRGSAGVDARTGKGNAYETPLRDTRHGRIWRVFPTGVALRSQALDANSTTSLLQGLAADNQTVRLQAQRLLQERGLANTSPEVQSQLRELLTAGGTASPHALELLAAAGQLPATALASALHASHEPLRRRAIAHADPAQLRAAYLRGDQLTPRGRDLALVLVGLSKAAADDELGAALYRFAKADERTLFADPALREAWTLAARNQAGAVLAAAAQDGALRSGPRPVVNLLPNPSFAAGSDTVADGWTDLRIYGGGRPDDVTFGPASIGRTDGRSLYMRTARGIDCGIAVTVPVEPQTRYRLSGWLKTRGARGVRGAPGMMMNVHGGPRTRGLVGDHDWTEVAVEFDSGDRSEATVHCLFGGYGGASGEAWWDDVALVALGGGPTLAGALEELAALRPADAAASTPAPARRFAIDAAIHERGAAVYARTCVACHGIDGKGVAGVFPPLDGSDWVTGDPELPTKIVLHGLFGPLQVGGQQYNNAMTPLGPMLNDGEVADVLTYVRQRWGNDAAAVDTAFVAKVRAATKARTTMWTAKELGR
jgi:putative membrane-bound dehydrogenase-like protein